MANTKITAANIDSTSTGITFADLTVDTTTLVVDATNNRVGIGTNSPQETLHLFNSAQTWDQYANIRMSTESDSYAAEIGFHRGTSNDTDRGLFLSGDGTNKHVRVLHGGNVGIGTDNPAAKLDVSGVFQFFDDVSPEIKIVDSDDNNYALVGYSDGTMTLSSNHGNEAGGADVIQFLTGGTDRMLINSSGFVGIGTSSPSRKLHLYHPANDSNFLQFTNSTTGETGSNGFLVGIGAAGNAELWNYEAQPIIFGTSSSERMRIDSSGDVGIGGVTAPTGLEVYSKVCKFWHGNTTHYTMFEDQNEINTYTSAGANSTMYLQHPGGDLEVGAGVFFVDRSASSVGINTTSPDKQLHIKNTSTGDTGIVIENTNNAQNLDIDFYNNAGSAQGRIRYAEGAGSFGFAPNVSADDALHILYNGDIGFGTSNPFSYGGQNFEFKDTSSNQTGVRVTSAASSFEVGTDANGGYLQAITPGDGISFYSANSSAADIQAMKINSTGIVTTPYNPAFRAYLSTEQTSTGEVTSGYTDNDTTASRAYDRTGHFNISNGRFTAPVDGVYVFSIMWDSLNSLAGFNLLVNGSNYNVMWEPTGFSNAAWESKYYGTHVKLSTNDYVTLYIAHASGTNPVHQGSGVWGHFAGALIG